MELAVHAGGVYVVGSGADGGLLWGTSASAVSGATAGAKAAPAWPAIADPDLDPDAVATLDRLLNDPDAYAGRAQIRGAIFALAPASGSGDIFEDRLMGDAPARRVGLIGGRVRISSTTLRRWLLLWGMTLAGEGRVPPELIAEPWTAPQNDSEKYFDSPPGAMRAAAAIGQDDVATIDALIERLDRAGDPLWLRGDAVGALTELTGQRFAYDFEAWRDWWAKEKTDWRP